MVSDGGGARWDDPPMQERRHVAVLAFLGAGLSSAPSTAVLVSALAEARRAVAMYQARNLPVDAWLADEVHVRGVRENAAVLAVLELHERRAEIAEMYRRQHCACRIPRPCSSRGVLILVEDTAESVSPAHVEVGDSPWVCDRRGDSL
jgi:hypothetical protein